MRSSVAGMGWLFLIGLAVGCGGKVVTSSGEGEGEDSAPSSPSPGAGEPDDSSGGIDPRPDTELGDCVLGELISQQAGDCAWVARDRCYQTRDMACNCACPRERNSQCLSGFPAGPNGRVQVACD